MNLDEMLELIRSGPSATALISGAWDTPTETCPYCGKEMEADWVDIGVGMQKCGPYHCYECGASEIGFEGWDNCTEEERETGFYRGSVSPHANTFQGVPVSWQTAKTLYEHGLLDEKPGVDNEPN